ncbi:MAG: hypothetical protein KDB02_10365 [Acidimicrobiales bacterium]|nr:hypothetical protein [Acidimicrobiales bacterium]
MFSESPPTSSGRTGTRSVVRCIRGARTGAIVCACLLSFVGLAAGSASVAGAQDPTASTMAPIVSTAPPASGSATSAPSVSGLDPDTTPVTSVSESEQTAPNTDEIDEENRKFTIVVAGLIGVAFGLALLTLRYWKVTKPRPLVAPTVEDENPETGAGDAEADGELFVSTGEVTNGGSGRPSRRAIAGADHADVDAGWEPMATGEQERVSGQVPRATVRPDRDARARALGAAGVIGDSAPKDGQ